MLGGRHILKLRQGVLIFIQGRIPRLWSRRFTNVVETELLLLRPIPASRWK